MLLEKNGRRSAGKGSRHVKIKYFFIADKVKSKEVKILYCPTGDMTADFYTKPLQGSLFYKHRNAMLGIEPEDIPKCIKSYEQYIASLES